MVAMFKGGDGLAGERRRVAVVAAVQRGLAAAGLGLRHLDPAAGLFQQLEGGKADPGADGIDKAGHEKADAGAGGVRKGGGHGRDLQWMKEVRRAEGVRAALGCQGTISVKG